MSWARRNRSSAVVVLFAANLVLLLVVPGVPLGAWLSGVLMFVAGLWCWLAVVLRRGREFARMLGIDAIYRSAALLLAYGPRR